MEQKQTLSRKTIKNKAFRSCFPSIIFTSAKHPERTINALPGPCQDARPKLLALVNVSLHLFTTVSVARNGRIFSPDLGEHTRPFCRITTAGTPSRSFWFHCYSRPITYKRVTHGAYSTATLQSSPSVQSYTIKAGGRQYCAREIAGLVQQGDREVRIAAADLSFTPRPNDQVVIGGKTYQVVSVNTRSPFSEAAIHMVQVRGGNGS